MMDREQYEHDKMLEEVPRMCGNCAHNIDCHRCRLDKPCGAWELSTHYNDWFYHERA